MKKNKEAKQIKILREWNGENKEEEVVGEELSLFGKLANSSLSWCANIQSRSGNEFSEVSLVCLNQIKPSDGSEHEKVRHEVSLQ